MKTARLAWRQLKRDASSGELRILFGALVLAVLAMTTVAFVTDRAERALTLEANRLLGGDAVVRADAPIVGPLLEAARARGLRSVETRELQSMIRVVRRSAEDEQLQLGELRALGDGFPLLGSFRIIDSVGGPERVENGIPGRGTVWLSRAGADALGANPGDTLALGELELRLAALVTQEPNASLNVFDFAPKVFLHLDDLPATGLVQEGSRIRYRRVVTGEPAAVERFIKTAREALDRGQRLETVKDGQPQVRSTLDRASRFLGLAAMLTVLLAAVAVAMAARRHSERHLSGAAVMRCLGASQKTLVGIHVGELLLLGVIASGVGVTLALGLQAIVGVLLVRLLKISIPAAGIAPVLQGFSVGLVVLMAFGAPPVLALRRVSALRVLRRDLDATEPSAWLAALGGLCGLGVLLWWQAGSAKLAVTLLFGILATLAVLAGLAWAFIGVLRRVRSRLRGSLRYGLANVSRRARSSIAQIVSLGLGLMALLLLTFVRTSLLDRWQRALRVEAPNRFVINVQEEQAEAVRAFLVEQQVPAPTLYPMIRGRLVAHNGKPVTTPPSANEPATEPATEEDRATQRRLDREFSLSVASTLREDNEVTAGTFWGPERRESPEVSVEQGFADSLGWKLGDKLAFDIAGQRFEASITSFRDIDWESFRPNFFVVASPGALDGYPASYITSVKVPTERPRFTPELVARFPNLSVIDIDQALSQARRTADQVSTVIEVIFYFSLVAGLLVLMAAVSASQDERLLEGGVMRVLGGSRRQMRLAQASEFLAIGLLSGLTAAVAASALAGVVSTQVFDLPWKPDWRMTAAGAGVGMMAALAAGMFATRRVLEIPPSVTLRELER